MAVRSWGWADGPESVSGRSNCVCEKVAATEPPRGEYDEPALSLRYCLGSRRLWTFPVRIAFASHWGASRPLARAWSEQEQTEGSMSWAARCCPMSVRMRGGVLSCEAEAAVSGPVSDCTIDCTRCAPRGDVRYCRAGDVRADTARAGPEDATCVSLGLVFLSHDPEGRNRLGRWHQSIELEIDAGTRDSRDQVSITTGPPRVAQ